MSPVVIDAARRLPRWLHVPMPALVVAIGVLSGYWDCEHSVPLLELKPMGAWMVGAGLLALGVSLGTLYWKTPAGRRGIVVGLHLTIVIFSGILSSEAGTASGRYLWEQSILAPRVLLLQELARRGPDSPGPVDVTGYRFSAYGSSPQGALFCTVSREERYSKGIFVPFSATYKGFEPPQVGEPRGARSVTPTSVPGLFWIVDGY